MKFSFHNGFVFDVVKMMMKKDGIGWLLSGVNFFSPLFSVISGFEDTNVFHILRLQFLLVYNSRVATRKKRERDFDEQLAHILKFKQKCWALLVRQIGTITTIHSH